MAFPLYNCDQYPQEMLRPIRVLGRYYYYLYFAHKETEAQKIKYIFQSHKIYKWQD